MSSLPYNFYTFFFNNNLFRLDDSDRNDSENTGNEGK